MRWARLTSPLVFGAVSCLSIDDKPAPFDAGPHDSGTGGAGLGGALSGGAGGTGAAGSDGGGVSGSGGSLSCDSAQKPCGNKCVAKVDPLFGCSGSSCAPCALQNTSVHYCDANGSCAVVTCQSGYGDCDSDPSNGCEIDLTSDLDNCGSCGKACSVHNGTPSCAGSACQISCDSGYADCDGSADTGCEANLGDSSNCGSCGNDCGSNNCKNGNCCIPSGKSCGGSPCCSGTCIAKTGFCY